MARGGAEKARGGPRGWAEGRSWGTGGTAGGGLRGVAREESKGAESKRWGGVGEMAPLAEIFGTNENCFPKSQCESLWKGAPVQTSVKGFTQRPLEGYGNFNRRRLDVSIE